MFLEHHLHHLYKCIADFPGMKDAVALIKVWLHQRELDKVLASPLSLFATNSNCDFHEREAQWRFSKHIWAFEYCVVDSGQMALFPQWQLVTWWLSCCTVGDAPLLTFRYFLQEVRKVACDNTLILWVKPGHQMYPHLTQLVIVVTVSCNFFTQGQGCCSGFLVSMFISHLLLIKKINKQMSSYQILRVFLQFLGRYSKENLSLWIAAINFLLFTGQLLFTKYWSHFYFQCQMIWQKKE